MASLFHLENRSVSDSRKDRVKTGASQWLRKPIIANSYGVAVSFLLWFAKFLGPAWTASAAAGAPNSMETLNAAETDSTNSVQE